MRLWDLASSLKIEATRVFTVNSWVGRLNILDFVVVFSSLLEVLSPAHHAFDVFFPVGLASKVQPKISVQMFVACVCCVQERSSCFFFVIVALVVVVAAVVVVAIVSLFLNPHICVCLIMF